jgi:hypothetical protein
MLVLTKKIVQSYPDSFTSFMVIGKRGIGKSAYSLRALHDAYVILGYSDKEAWDKALDSLKFSIPDVVRYLKHCVDTDEKEVCLIWDDTRVFASGSQYHLQMKMVNKLIGLLDTVRTAICCLILTCPSPKGLLSILKTYDDYLVKIKHSDRGGYYRVATGYIWTTLPAGQRRIYTKFRDNFSCYLPVDVYNRYMGIRKQALADVLIELEQELKN